MHFSPLVSVLIRSVDREHLLSQALSSIASQTYPHIEVVLVSAKPGHREPQGWGGRFNLRFLPTDQSLSRSQAANRALEAALGEYLLFLDDDDVILPHHIEGLVKGLSQAQARNEVVAAYSDYLLVDAQLENPKPSGMPVFDPIRLLAGNFLSIHTVLFRREVIMGTQSVRFDEDLDLLEDWDFWIQLSEQGDFVRVDQVSAWYRIHPSSGVHQLTSFQSQAHQHIYRKWVTRISDERLRALMTQIWQSHVFHDRLAGTSSEVFDLEYLTQKILAQKAELQGEVHQLQGEVHQLQGEKTLAQAQLGEARSLLTGVLQSKSWRLSAPLRWLARQFKTLMSQAKRLGRQGIQSLQLKSLKKKIPWVSQQNPEHRALNHQLFRYRIEKPLQCAAQEESMALLCTYSPDGEVSKTTRHYLKALSDQGLKVVLCVAVDDPELTLEGSNLEHASAIVVRENAGYDFGCWAGALSALPDLWKAQLLIFTNDSVLGPLDTFAHMMNSIRQSPSTCIALTDSFQHRYHFQSYFFALKQPALAHPLVRRFWSEMLCYRQKQEVIDHYELNLAKLLSQDAQLPLEVLFPMERVAPHIKPRERGQYNSTHHFWRELIHHGFPFIKGELLYKNPMQLPIEGWSSELQLHLKDEGLIDAIQSQLDHLRRTRS